MRGEKGINDKKQNKKAQQQKAISKPRLIMQMELAVVWNKNNKSDGTVTDALQLNCRVGEFDVMLGKHNLGLMQSSWIHIG